MAYKNPDIDSSYQPNNLGKTLYDQVISIRPQIVVDFGILNGYSTIAMAQALRDLRHGGKVFAMDLFEKYPHKHPERKKLEKNLKEYGVDDYVELVDMNFFDWVKSPSAFDLLHLDISNDGDIVDVLWEAFKDSGKHVLFEGGSERRDRVGWMTVYNKKPINKSKAQYEVINKLFPSISKLTT